MNKATFSVIQYWARKAAYHDMAEQKYLEAARVAGLPDEHKEKLEALALEESIKASKARFRGRVAQVEIDVADELARQQGEWKSAQPKASDDRIPAQWAGPTDEDRVDDAIQRGTIAVLTIGVLVLLVVGVALTVQKVM
jgi:hypothetical protein